MAQKWLVCEPLEIDLQPINKELMLLMITTGAKENCVVPNKIVRHINLSKTNILLGTRDIDLELHLIFISHQNYLIVLTCMCIQGQY